MQQSIYHSSLIINELISEISKEAFLKDNQVESICPLQMTLNAVLETLELKNLWISLLTTESSIQFFQQAVLKAIQLLKSNHYSQFDAHTMSNCCHGISLTVSLAIEASKNFDYDMILDDFSGSFLFFNNGLGGIEQILQALPEPTLLLVSAYILCKAGDLEEGLGRVTKPEILQEISPSATKKFSIKLIKKLQRGLSKSVANNYYNLSLQLPEEHKISGVQTQKWAKYIASEEIRSDKRGLYYASCLFSTQVTLAYLAFHHRKVAIVNDIVSKNGEKKGRYVHLMQGNGQGFRSLSHYELSSLSPSEPVFIIGGFTVSDEHTLESFREKMTDWLEQISELILANDTHYPQFPSVSDDSYFNNEPIVPQESIILELISKYSKVQGVKKDDPSFFLQNHYYPASLEEVLHDMTHEKERLPFSPDFTPNAF